MPGPTPQVEHAICDLVARGWPVSRAARFFDIQPRTARGWLDQGRRGRAHFVRFAESVQAARLEHEREVEQFAEELRGRIL